MVTRAEDNPFPSVLMVEQDPDTVDETLPASGQRRLVVGLDHLLYLVDDAGVATEVGASAGLTDPMTTRGDIIVRNASNVTARLAKGSADTFLHSDGTDLGYAAVTDAMLSTSDITTNNASTSKHGFLKKLDNNAAHFMDGTGAWSAPSGSAGALTMLSDDTVTGSDASDITKTGISGSYKDLIIVVTARGAIAATTDDLLLRVGSGSIDTGTNYAIFQVMTGTTINNGSSAGGIYLGLCLGNNATAGYFSAHECVIHNYASTSQAKASIVSHAYFAASPGGLQGTGGTTWKNTSAAIDQLRLYAGGGNLKVGTRMTVYGRS